MRGAASHSLLEADAENACRSASDVAFREVSHHNGEGSALREKGFVAVEIMKRLGEHRYFVPISPIRRHLLDLPEAEIVDKSTVIRCACFFLRLDDFRTDGTPAAMAFKGLPIGISDGLAENRHFWRCLFPGLGRRGRIIPGR